MNSLTVSEYCTSQERETRIVKLKQNVGGFLVAGQGALGATIEQFVVLALESTGASP